MVTGDILAHLYHARDDAANPAIIGRVFGRDIAVNRVGLDGLPPPGTVR